MLWKRTRDHIAITYPRIDENRCEPVALPRSDPVHLPTEVLTAALLDWLQGPNGMVGEVLATEVRDAHTEMCAERNWAPGNWNAIATQLRRLLKQKKQLATRNRIRHVVYFIAAKDETCSRVQR